MTNTATIVFLWAYAGTVGARIALPGLNLGQRIFLFGCFGLLSTYLVAVLALLFIAWGIINLQLILLCCAILILVISFCIKKLLARSCDRDVEEHDCPDVYIEDAKADTLVQIAITTLSLVFFVSYAYRTGLEPLWGWDTLWYWGVTATNIITEPLNGSWLFTAAPHPSTAPALLALPVLGDDSDRGVPSIFWMLTLASLLAMIYGQALAVTASKVCASILPFVFATMPLAENLASSPGYAELFVCGSIFSFSAAFCFRVQSRFWLLLCCAPLLSLFITKNTGALLFLIMAGAAFLQLLVDRGVSFWFLMKVFAVMAVLVFLAMGVFQYLGHSIIIGHRTLEFDVLLLPIIFINEFHGKILNQSFSIIPALFFITLGAVFLVRTKRQRHPILNEKPFFLFSIGGVLLMLLFSQLTTYGFGGGQPKSDTIISRHSLTLATLIIAALPYVCLTAISGSHRYKES